MMESQLIYRDGAIDYVSLTKERLDEALQLQASTMRNENIAIAVGMFEEDGAPEEMQLVFKEVVKDGISMIAVDSETNKVVGVIFNKIHIPSKDGEKSALDEFIERNIKHRSCVELIRFLDHIEGKVNIFERYNVDAFAEMFYVATDSSYRARGIGFHLTRCSAELGKRLERGEIRKIPIVEEIVHKGAVPKVAIAVCTSIYTQRIAAKLAADVLAEILYEDWLVNGVKFSERIDGKHEKATLIACVS